MTALLACAIVPFSQKSIKTEEMLLSPEENKRGGRTWAVWEIISMALSLSELFESSSMAFIGNEHSLKYSGRIGPTVFFSCSVNHLERKRGKEEDDE